MDITLAIICGLGYRLKGSAGPEGWVERIFKKPMPLDTARLLFWAFLIQTFLLFKHPELAKYGWAIFLAAWVGIKPGYFNGEFDLEKYKNNNWKNYLRLTLKGMSIAAPICFTLYICRQIGVYQGSLGLLGIAAGSLFVPYYKMSIPISRHLRVPMLQGFSEWGEFFLGTSIAYGVLYG